MRTLFIFAKLSGGATYALLAWIFWYFFQESFFSILWRDRPGYRIEMWWPWVTVAFLAVAMANLSGFFELWWYQKLKPNSILPRRLPCAKRSMGFMVYVLAFSVIFAVFTRTDTLPDKGLALLGGVIAAELLRGALIYIGWTRSPDTFLLFWGRD